MSFDRIKQTVSRINLAEMNIPWKDINAHLVLDRKGFSEPTKDDNVFNAANIIHGQGHRPLDKAYNGETVPAVAKEDVAAPTGEDLNEEVDLAVARLRVRRAKLKKKIKLDPHNTKLIAELASVTQRLKNLAAGAKARDTWAKNAEQSHKGPDDGDDEDNK